MIRYMLFFAAALAAAQTTVPPSVIRSPNSVNGLVYVVVPSKGMVPVEMEGLEIIVDPATQIAKLRVPPPTTTPAQIKPHTQTVRATAATPELDLTVDCIAGSLHVYRNGLLMSETDDYTIAARKITWVASQTPQSGDIVQARCLIP